VQCYRKQLKQFWLKVHDKIRFRQYPYPIQEHGNPNECRLQKENVQQELLQHGEHFQPNVNQ